MSYVVTPSEKARAKCNPHPVGVGQADGHGGFNLILKNIFGFPIPYLEFLVFTGVLLATFLMEASLWLLLLLGTLYLLTDFISRKKEGRIFFSGFEWFYLALPFFLLAACGFQWLPFLNAILYFRWIFVLMLLPPILYLFPGVNTWLFLLIFGGLALAIFGHAQHFIGWHPSQVEYPIAYSHFSFDGYAISGFFESPLTFGLVLTSILSFISTRLLYELKQEGHTNFLYLVMTIIVAAACFFTYDLRIWCLTVLAFLIPCFFASKKYFIVGVIGLLGFFYLSFWLIEPFRNVFLFLQKNFETLQLQMHTIHSQWFEIISNHLWLGEQKFHLNLLTEHFSSSDTQENIMENSYLLLLKQVGVIGFVLFIAFFLRALMLNLRLLKDIPNTHTWHKVLVLGTLCMQVNMHLAALFFPIFHYNHILFFFVSLLSILIYFDDAYGKGIVPDDACL